MKVFTVQPGQRGPTVKSVSISDPAAAALLEGLQETTSEDDTRQIPAARLQQYVPWVYRSIDLRSTSVSAMPFALLRNQTELDRAGDDYQRWSKLLRRLLSVTEGDLCLSGAAYWLVTPNVHNVNWYPRRLLPSTIKPLYDADGMLKGFERRLKGIPKNYPDYHNRKAGEPFILHFWMDRYDAETGPGTPPAQAAAFDAETVYNMGRHQRRFWRNGAIKNTVFFLDSGSAGGGLQPMPTEAELNALVAAWKRITSGVKNAWNTVAMRYNFVPHQIGTDPADLAAKELMDLAVSAIAAAFGIPESLLKSLSATYAGATVDDWHFVSKTIAPHLERAYAEPLDQFFSLSGLRFDWRYEEHGSYQAYQLEEARTVAELVERGIMTRAEARHRIDLPVDDVEEGGLPKDVDITPTHIIQGILTRNEAREFLGLPPEDMSGDERRREIMEALSILQAATSAGLPVQQGLDLARVPGLDLMQASSASSDTTTTSARLERARALLERISEGATT